MTGGGARADGCPSGDWAGLMGDVVARRIDCRLGIGGGSFTPPPVGIESNNYSVHVSTCTRH